jgi:hypothetical protein
MPQEKSGALNLRRREPGAEEFVSRQEEKLRLAVSGRAWVEGEGGVFWANAIRHARPGQFHLVMAVMQAARTKGAQVARPARPLLTA